MKQRDQRLWEALQDFDTHKHLHADVLVQELAQKYDVSAEDLRKAIDRGGLAVTETDRNHRHAPHDTSGQHSS